MIPIKNPRKQFNFRITVLDNPILEPFAAQVVNLPDMEVEATEHGFGNTVIKTAGLVKVGTLTIERIMSAALGSITSSAFHAWQKLAQDGAKQTGGDPVDYKKYIYIEELSNASWDGLNDPVVLNSWTCVGCWPARINGREYSRTSSDNLMETAEFAVDYMVDGLIE